MICHCPPLAPAPSPSPPPVLSLSPALLLLISALAAWLLSSTRGTSQQHQQTIAAGHLSFTSSAPEPALPLPSSSVPRSELGVVCLGAPPDTAPNLQYLPCFAAVYLYGRVALRKIVYLAPFRDYALRENQENPLSADVRVQSNLDKREGTHRKSPACRLSPLTAVPLIELRLYMGPLHAVLA
jgi:hypothetical protein